MTRAYIAICYGLIGAWTLTGKYPWSAIPALVSCGLLLVGLASEAVE